MKQKGSRINLGETREILSEEEYITILSSIITRDYYPSIPCLRHEDTMMEIQEIGDLGQSPSRSKLMHDEFKNISAGFNYRDYMDSGITTEFNIANITDFHGCFTSEDNELFERKMKKKRKERREHLDLIYGGYIKENRLLESSNNEFSDTVEKIKYSNSSVPNSTCVRVQENKCIKYITRPTHRVPIGFAHDSSKEICPQNRIYKFFRSSNEHKRTQMNYSLKPMVAKNRKIPSNYQQKILVKQPLTVSLHGNPHKYVNESCIIAQQTRFSYQNEQITSAIDMLPLSSYEHLLSKVRYHNICSSSFFRLLGNDSKISFLSLNRDIDYNNNVYGKVAEIFVSMTPLNMQRESNIIVSSMEQNKSSGNWSSINNEIKSPVVTWGNLLSTPIVLGESTLECEIDFNLFQLVSNAQSYDINVGFYVEMNGLEIPSVLKKYGDVRNLSESLTIKSKGNKKRRKYHSITSQRKKNRKSLLYYITPR